MSSQYLESIAQHLVYNPEESPVENIEQFFNATKAIQYERVEIKVKDQIVHRLEGPWKDEIHLSQITSKFQDAFARHIVKISLTEQVDYLELLSECKHQIREATYHFNMPFTSALITLRPLPPSTDMRNIHHTELSVTDKETIYRCYFSIGIMFQQLSLIVEDEVKEFQYKEYIRTQSSFMWNDEKTKLSELVLALSVSGWIKDTKGNPVKPNILARALAALFNIKVLHYDQNLATMTNKNFMSKTEGLEHLIKKTREYLVQRADNQD